MGRKIKGKRHHGTKDPEKQQQKRMELIKLKINNRPSKEDHQEIPKKMKILMESKVKQTGHHNQQQHVARDKPVDLGLLDSTKYLTKEMKLPGMTKPLRPVPVFKQNPGEHKRAFYYRIDQTIQSMKQQRDYEEKYGVEFQRDQTGNTRMVEKPKDELEQLVDEQRQQQLAKKGIKVRSKEEKRRLRRERERMRKNKTKRQHHNNEGSEAEEEKDFHRLADPVGFGEVAHAPPTLKGLAERKPGAKDLLLKTKLSGGIGKKQQQAVPATSLARKAMLEKERQHVVQLYRAMKAEKMNSRL